MGFPPPHQSQQHWRGPLLPQLPDTSRLVRLSNKKHVSKEPSKRNSPSNYPRAQGGQERAGQGLGSSQHSQTLAFPSSGACLSSSSLPVGSWGCSWAMGCSQRALARPRRPDPLALSPALLFPSASSRGLVPEGACQPRACESFCDEKCHIPLCQPCRATGASWALRRERNWEKEEKNTEERRNSFCARIRVGKVSLGMASPGCSITPKCSDSIPRTWRRPQRGWIPSHPSSRETSPSCWSQPSFPSPNLLLSLLPWCFPTAPVPGSWRDSGPALVLPARFALRARLQMWPGHPRPEAGMIPRIFLHPTSPSKLPSWILTA